MITIFRGRKLSLHGTEEVIYAEVAVALRDQIHHFNTGKNCNPFAVFMKIALHTDEYGWAYPGSDCVSAGTGISTPHALASARTHLQKVRIDGHRVLEMFRERKPDGTFGRRLYRIFPDAWTDGLDHVPTGFDASTLTQMTMDQVDNNDTNANEQPHVDNPHVDDPHAEKPHADNRHYKKNHLDKDHQAIRSGSAGLIAPVTEDSSEEPLVNDQLPAEEKEKEAIALFEPCDLATFIAANSKYQFKAGDQHDRLLRLQPEEQPRYPAPNDYYLDEKQGEAFKAWVLTKIEWAEGDKGRHKPLKSLVSAICNYSQPQFGWFAFWNAWVEQEQGEKGERRGKAPGHPGRANGSGNSPTGKEGAARQRHWAQVAQFLAGATRSLG